MYPKLMETILTFLHIYIYVRVRFFHGIQILNVAINIIREAIVEHVGK